MTASTEPRGGLDLGWTPGEDGWGDAMNANLLRLSRLGFHPSVLSATTTAPPGSPISGSGYIIPAGATGAWVGHAGQVAVWDGSAWAYAVPRDGWTIHVVGTGLVTYEDGAWSQANAVKPAEIGAEPYAGVPAQTSFWRSTAAGLRAWVQLVAADITDLATTLAGYLTKANPTFTGRLSGNDVKIGGGSTSGWLQLVANDTGSGTFNIDFLGGASSNRRMTFRWSDTLDNLNIMTSNDDGSARLDRVLIPRSSALPIAVAGGLNVSTGNLSVGGVAVVDANRNITGTNVSAGSLSVGGVAVVDSSRNITGATVKGLNAAGVGIRPAVALADGTFDDQDAAVFLGTIGAAPSSHTHPYLPIANPAYTGRLTGPTQYLEANEQILLAIRRPGGQSGRIHGIAFQAQTLDGTWREFGRTMAYISNNTDAAWTGGMRLMAYKDGAILQALEAGPDGVRVGANLPLQMGTTTVVDASRNITGTTVKGLNLTGAGNRPLVAGADGTIDDQDAATFRGTIAALASSNPNFTGILYQGGIQRIASDGTGWFQYLNSSALAGSTIRPLVVRADGLFVDQDAATFLGTIGALAATLKGAANGVAELGADGKVPSAQLPSYVDDVLEYANFAALPATGETGKIYITQDNNKTWRWSGSAYVEISASLALGETSATAYRGDRGKTAYTHSQATGNPHGTTAADVGAAVKPSVGTQAGDWTLGTSTPTGTRQTGSGTLTLPAASATYAGLSYTITATTTLTLTIAGTFCYLDANNSASYWYDTSTSVAFAMNGGHASGVRKKIKIYCDGAEWLVKC